MAISKIKGERTLLWRNTFYDYFVPQTVSGFNPQDYKFIEIGFIYAGAWGDDNKIQTVQRFDTNYKFHCLFNTNMAAWSSRKFQITNSGIVFQVGSNSSVGDSNEAAVPTEIWGIR